MHSGDNLSNHSAIYMKVSLGDIELSMEQPKREKMVSWDKASDDAKDNFKLTLQAKLLNLAEPGCADCLDLHCSDHTAEIEDYTMYLRLLRL